MSSVFEINDEIVEIEYIGEQETIDIEVSGNRLFYANGILTHNSSVEEVEYDHSHIAGGISKIQTADNVIGIFTSKIMRDKGRYQVQFMKTRSSSGVGQKVDLKFCIDTLRIEDLEDGEEGATEVETKSIEEKLKRRNVIVKKGPEKTEEVASINTTDNQSTRLRQLMKKLD